MRAEMDGAMTSEGRQVFCLQAIIVRLTKGQTGGREPNPVPFVSKNSL